MKKENILIPIVMVALLVVGWLAFFVGIASNNTNYNECIKNAKDSMDAELYEQAIEFYKESLGYKSDEGTYLLIKEAYDLLYAEETTDYIRGCYIDDMAAAAAAYPNNEMFWVKQIQLYMEESNYKKAYSVAKSAINGDVKSDEVNALYKELLYMVKISYKEYEHVETALNGYVTVFDGTYWTVLDDLGEPVVGKYKYIGLINNEGKGLYINDIGCRILDNNQVARAKFSQEFTGAGYYNESVNLMPVEQDGIWRYTNDTGDFLPGQYDVAGSFYGEYAVACRDGVWMTVKSDGTEETLSGIQDVKLDLYGCHVQNDIIICKQNGAYHLYDTKFNVIGNFEADDIDICVDSKGIAFKKNGLWGFVDLKGNVVIEPQYADAKSYANGYAAVCNKDGKWGFINSKGELVIDYTYLDAMYFTSQETCWISLTEGQWQLLRFMFD